MSKKEKHIETSDIIGILIPFGLSVFTLIVSGTMFFLYYLGVSLFRFFILILQMVIVRSKDTPEKKFKKERRLCRFVGLSFVFVIAVYSFMLLWFATGMKSEFFINHPWTIAIYFLYALYKLISGYIQLKKSRRSFSPYREVIANLSFLDAMATTLNAVALTFAVTSFLTKSAEQKISLAMMVVIIVISFIMGFKMIKSRKVPNLIQE